MTAPAAWALHTDLPLEEANARLAHVDALGMVETEGKTTIYFADRGDGVALPGRWERVPARDWNATWKAGIEAVTVGAITIVPPWLPAPADAEIVLTIEPAQAFGTGHHETTTGCLGALQEVGVSGRSVLDVGTGTGVLALAAARLGASRVVATDTDPVAVATAIHNATANAVDLDVRPGSVDAASGEQFDVVVANLDTGTLVSLANDLAGAVSGGGCLIASGVSIRRQHEAVAALAGAGVAVVTRRGREWVLLLGRRPP